MAHDLVFANARVKARENNLLTRDKLLRMLEGDLNEAFSILSEVQYDVEGGDVDVICAKEEERLVEFMKELDVDRPFIDCLISEYDYKTLKRAFKMKMVRQDFDFSPLTIAGRIPLDKVKSSVMSDEYDVYPQFIADVLRRLDALSVTDKVKPSTVETQIDGAMYTYFLDKLQGKVGYDYYLKRVFLTNLITLIRVNRLGLDVDFFESQYVGDKALEWEKMSQLVGESVDNVFEAYRVSEYKDVVEEMVNQEVDIAETYADDILVRQLSSYKAEMFSELLLAGYFVAKKAEIQNVRLILTCIKNKVDTSEVGKRLRVCYYE